MIIFDLACECGFQFEGWFQDHNDYTRQLQSAILECPHCESHQVHKILSPVAYHGHASSIAKNETSPCNATDPHPKEIAEALKALQKIQNHVIKNFTDVGPDLAKRALKMHYGVEEPKNIRGSTTKEEEKTLEKEGINLLKIPLPIKDKNDLN